MRAAVARRADGHANEALERADQRAARAGPHDWIRTWTELDGLNGRTTENPQGARRLDGPSDCEIGERNQLEARGLVGARQVAKQFAQHPAAGLRRLRLGTLGLALQHTGEAVALSLSGRVGFRVFG